MTIKLTAAEKSAFGNMPDYILETLPRVADSFLILIRRQMASSAKQPEGLLTMTAFVTAVQMVINLADTEDVRRKVCEWIMAGKIPPAS